MQQEDLDVADICAALEKGMTEITLEGVTGDEITWTEDGEPNLENIEDDDEYDAAADKFDEWMDSLEFDEIDLDAE